MKKDKHKTKVIFYLEKGNSTTNETPFAYFPEEYYNNIGANELRTCYAHVGQHSCCNPSYAKKCKKAKYNQFYDLAKELGNLGYNLTILNKMRDITYHRKPTASEIRFGYGATHYKDFTKKDFLKHDGSIKKRIKDKSDGLIYTK